VREEGAEPTSHACSSDHWAQSSERTRDKWFRPLQRAACSCFSRYSASRKSSATVRRGGTVLTLPATLLVPGDEPDPEDTVCVYAMYGSRNNDLRRFSTGMLWGQLGSAGISDGLHSARGRNPTATFARGVLMLPGMQKAELLDITGRRTLDLRPGENDVSNLPPGVYCVRTAPGTEQGTSEVRRVVIAH